jgi:hypothetical protein
MAQGVKVEWVGIGKGRVDAFALESASGPGTKPGCVRDGGVEIDDGGGGGGKVGLLGIISECLCTL